MPFKSLADVLAEKFPPTARQQEAIDQVQSVAISFAAGDSTLADVRRATTARQRNLTIRHTPPSHPSFRSMVIMLDALCAEDPTAFLTKHGLIGHDDLVSASGKINRDEPRERIMFATGTNKETGEAIYRPSRQEVTAQLPARPEIEWWEE